MEPEFDNPNGILVNSYNPEGPAQNAIFCMSASAIGINR